MNHDDISASDEEAKHFSQAFLQFLQKADADHKFPLKQNKTISIRNLPSQFWSTEIREIVFRYQMKFQHDMLKEISGRYSVI